MIDVVRGSGNVFADFGDARADVKQARTHMAAEIIRVLNASGMAEGEAAERAGVGVDDIRRIRAADLAGIDLDLLMKVLTGLGYDLEIRHRPAEPGQGRVHFKVLEEPCR